MTTTTHPALYAILWALIPSWFYGYHLTELNFPLESITCSALPSRGFSLSSALRPCLGINEGHYGLITAMFTVGGLAGSLGSSWVVRQKGIKGGLVWTAWLNLLGTAVMALSPHWSLLALGRAISGISGGVVICLVPPFLNFIARGTPRLAHRSGQIGTLKQMALVTGIFSSQVAGRVFTGPKGDLPGMWRYVVALSGVASAVQLVTAGFIVSPDTYKPKAERSVLGDTADTADECAPLLEAAPVASSAVPPVQLSLRQVLTDKSTRGPSLFLCSIFLLQQFTGVNSVMFYSAPVLKPLLPNLAGAIGLGVTLVNALTTVVAIFLVDRVGRRALLLASICGMTVSSAALGYGLDHGLKALCACAIIAYIVAFAVGLGPVPFLLVSETVPAPGIPALSSLSLSLSWISTFIVAITFLPLRNALSSPADPSDPSHPHGGRIGEGRVFYLFAAVCAFTAVLVWHQLGKKPKIH